jgi:hypothetical protein
MDKPQPTPMDEWAARLLRELINDCEKRAAVVLWWMADLKATK